MSSSIDPSDTDTAIEYPIPISKLANHYYIYNVHHVTHLRRHHNIPGVLIGSLPQAPQQNFFLGLPIQLLHEEARYLVESGVCYIVEDAKVHRQGLESLREEEKLRYIEGLREQGREISRAVVRKQEGNMEKALKGMSEEKRAMILRKKEEARMRATMVEAQAKEAEIAGNEATEDDDEDDNLFPSYARGTPDSPTSSRPPRPATPTPSVALSSTSFLASTSHHHITPTTTSTSLITPPTPPTTPPPTTLPPVNPSAYALYKHLHAHSYFLSPGLRFGCQYTAYPGDPLRFHSHFLCRGYAWDEEIDLLDLVGGGRLGTGVKKGYLVGGTEVVEGPSVEEGEVRTFCIEWGGM